MAAVHLNSCCSMLTVPRFCTVYVTTPRRRLQVRVSLKRGNLSRQPGAEMPHYSNRLLRNIHLWKDERHRQHQQDGNDITKLLNSVHAAESPGVAPSEEVDMDVVHEPGQGPANMPDVPAEQSAGQLESEIDLSEATSHSSDAQRQKTYEQLNDTITTQLQEAVRGNPQVRPADLTASIPLLREQDSQERRRPAAPVFITKKGLQQQLRLPTFRSSVRIRHPDFGKGRMSVFHSATVNSIMAPSNKCSVSALSDCATFRRPSSHF